jgi:hypothetical protein
MLTPAGAAAREILRTLPQLQQFAELVGHGQTGGARFSAKRVDYLVELVFRPQRQVEEEDLLTAKFAAASGEAAKPFLPDSVSQAACQINGRL